MVDYLSYGQQWITQKDIESVVDTLRSDYLTQGPKVEQFESKMCDITGAKYCVAVANGTAALHLAVKALNIEEGKEGITSPNTFVASANCMAYNGLKPNFADIDSRSYNIDPDKIEDKINENTELLIPVHFAGQPARMGRIADIAKKDDLRIIEDASHAIGSNYSDGSKVGNCKYSDMTTFSFHPVKTVTAGEGGAITTNNLELYKKLKILRTHGITKDEAEFNNEKANKGPWYYEMQELGFNYRLSDIHSALALSQLDRLQKFKERRRQIFKKYNNAFSDIDWLETPQERETLNSCFHLYVLQIDFDDLGMTRKEVMNKLREKKIGTQVHYIPVHTQPFYKDNYGYEEGDYPNAEEYYQKALSIPLFPKMSDSDIDRVIENIKNLSE